MKKGLFITLYGINNIGKSTHAKRLCRKLEEQGHKAKYVKYPIYDIEPTGPFLDGTLRNEDGQSIPEDELQLWFIMNRYQFQPQLKKWIDEGYIVVAEDYVGTGIAWGMAKGLSEDWLESANSHLIREDFSIVIEGERCLGAREKHHVHEQNDTLVARCIKTHDHLANKYEWKRVQLQEQKDDTAKLIWNVVDDYLKESYI